ncbi:MAG: hypothetical protein ACJA1F_000705 [Paracoccaceae bacterium]|jgi:hypothetical protein|tara:strand:+ start:573 stop:716 length:144 start_codon:yes stop_codon:yes gene_type:complete
MGRYQPDKFGTRVSGRPEYRNRMGHEDIPQKSKPAKQKNQQANKTNP